MIRRFLLVLLVVVACVGCDQTTKSVAQSVLPTTASLSFLGDTLRLQVVHNQGAFLNLGATLPQGWRQGIFLVGVGVLLAALLAYALFARSVTPVTATALALIVAGGLGNLLDRVAHDGYVVDFINIGIGSLRTGIFNVADMAVTAGVLLAVAVAARTRAATTNPQKPFQK